MDLSFYLQQIPSKITSFSFLSSGGLGPLFLLSNGNPLFKEKNKKRIQIKKTKTKKEERRGIKPTIHILLDIVGKIDYITPLKIWAQAVYLWVYWRVPACVALVGKCDHISHLEVGYMYILFRHCELCAIRPIFYYQYFVGSYFLFLFFFNLFFSFPFLFFSFFLSLSFFVF